MEPNDHPKNNREKPEGLIIYKPEDQTYQKLHLCDYLGELYEAFEKENEQRTEKKKDFQRHTVKK